MLGNSKIIAFVATAKPTEAQTFYTETLGLRELEDTPFAIVLDANGTELRVQKVESMTPSNHTVLGWNVGDIVATIQYLVKNGVRFERFDGLPQNELEIWTAPGGAKIAWFKDPDGNILSITECAT